MSKKKFAIIFVIISLIISGILVISNYYFQNIEEEIYIEDYIGDTTTSTNTSTTITSKLKNKIKKIVKTTIKNNDYLLVLEIPKINIKKGVYNKNNKLNNVDKNITILKDSSMPDEVNGSVILASHNGNTRVSYFKHLEKLNINDQVYIYYKGYKYTYKIYKSEVVNKVGQIKINKKSNVSNIVLISCKNGTNDKQVVYLGELIKKDKY